ncbi:MAG TPA: hypothetical protein PLF81_07685 [Candidatus Anammoximicrobium sp.]|nr:hypothetical protein [Candidatus Anammoximicrobium sp.]
MATTLYSGADLQLVSPIIPSGDSEQAEMPASSGPAVWQRVIEELQRMGMLPDDWDGQGAQAPPRETVDWALDWVGQMRRYRQALPPSRAVPGVAGEVYLEWQGESFYVVAEITSPARVEWTSTISFARNSD